MYKTIVLRIITCVWVLLPVSIAHASEAPTFLSNDRQVMKRDGWLVYRNNSWRGCFAERKFQDGSIALLGRMFDSDDYVLGFRNGNTAPLEADKSYPTTLNFDDGAFEWKLENTTAYNHGKGKIVVTITDSKSDLFGDIEKYDTLRVFRESRVMATLDFTLMRGVLVELNTCYRGPYDVYNVGNLSPSQQRKLQRADTALTNGLASYDKGQYRSALRSYRTGLALRREVLGSKHALVGEAHNLMAGGHLAVANYNKAEGAYREALKVQEQAIGPRSKEYAAIVSNLAVVFFQRSNYSKSVELNRQAMKIRAEIFGPESILLAESQNNLANALANLNELAEAEGLYRRSLKTRERLLGLDHLETASSLNNLGSLLLKRKNYDDAEPLVRRGLAIRQKKLGGEHPDIAASLGLIGTIALKKRNFALAQDLFEKALKIERKVFSQSHPAVLETENALAVTLAESGNGKEARRLYRRTLARKQKRYGRNNLHVATALNNLANAYRNQGRYRDSMNLHVRALDIRRRVLGATHPDVANSFNNMSNLSADHRKYGEALKFARAAFEIGQPKRGTYLDALKYAPLEKEEQISESLVVVQHTAQSTSGAALRSLAARFSVGEGALAELVRTEQDLTGELADLNGALIAEASKEPSKRNKQVERKARKRISTITSDLDDIRAKLAKDFPNYAELRKPSPLGLREIQSLLDSDEALIVIDNAKTLEGYDYTWAVTSDQAKWQQLKVAQGGISKQVAELRKSLNLDVADRQSFDPIASHAVYRSVLQPVEDVFADKKHLIFVLNGPLSSIPPHLLVTRPPANQDLRAVQWLVRDHAVTVLPAIASLKLLRKQSANHRAPKPFIGYADPVFGTEQELGETESTARNYSSFFDGGQTDVEALKAGLPRLPATGVEVRSVAKSVGATQRDVVVRDNASETHVKNASLEDYNIVYFATHGLVAGEVEQVGGSGAEPALALTIPDEATDLDDGLLTASEIAQLKLNADWVVMSACNTAAGGKPGADALSGLARAFFYAGARSLLVSHWVVDDNATAELMTQVFKRTSDNPEMRAASALQQAMLSMIDHATNSEWSDPAFWAPFVLVGEPRRG